MNIFFLMNGNIFNYSLALENIVGHVTADYLDVIHVVHMQYHLHHPEI